MPTQESATIELVTRDDYAGSRSKLDLVTEKLNVDDLRKQFQAFMTSLQSIVAIDDAHTGAFQLKEIQFSAEISANGEFKLIGTGVGIEAKSAVTFVLQRKQSE